MAGPKALTVDDLPKVLPHNALFKDLALQLVERAIKGATLLDLRPNDALEPHVGGGGGDNFYFVVRGQMGVIRNRPIDQTVELAKSHRPNPGREYILYFVEGDFFSDDYLSLPGVAEDPGAIRCVAIMHASIMVLSKKLTLELMKLAPDFADVLRVRNGEIRDHYLTHRSGDLRIVQDFYLQHNFGYATTLKVIDLDRCIGCDGCERACRTRHGVARLERKGPILGRLSFPVSCRTCEDHRCFHACGFDAINILDSHEVKLNSDKCVGCSACASACPNNVISMKEKPYVAKDFPKEIPFTDPQGMTNIEDLYLCGESTGTALIKLAINSGNIAVKAAAEKLKAKPKPGGPDVVDIIVCGAGPAGLSAALTAQELGLSYKCFDKGSYNTTIGNFPRKKLVMAEPAHIPLFGGLWLQNTSKEELIEKWKELIERTKVQIDSHEAVTAVKRGDDGIFEVTTEKGAYKGRNVILALGARGAPRKLGVKGEAEPRVLYALTEPSLYKGKHVLVVGGGDSAVEAARSITDEGGTATLSYRKDSFGRIKKLNQQLTDEYVAAGKMTVILESSVKSIGPDEVVLKCKDGEKTIKNETIFALLGAEPPTKFFEACGVKIIQPSTPEMDELAKSRGNRRYSSKCDHCTGFEDQACISACPTGAIMEIKPEQIFAPRPGSEVRRAAFNADPFTDGMPKIEASKRLGWIASVSASFALIAATLVGIECFLRKTVPEWSLSFRYQRAMGIEPSVTFWAGSGLGFLLGIVGTLLMTTTALYPLHSRLGMLRSLTKTRFWLALHIIAGILGPVFVTYHSTLKIDRWPAAAMGLAWVVVLTGALGRNVFTMARRAQGLAGMEKQRAETEGRTLIDELAHTRGATQVINILHLAKRGPAQIGILGALRATVLFFFGEALLSLRKLKLKHFTLRRVLDRAARDRAVAVFMERKRKDDRANLLDAVTRSVSVWRKIHLTATLAMFAVAVAHMVAAMLFRVSG
jgi:thioredoxin reductase/Pyruvate/2-oxoacid:ferredoxin oxidoreductase delta subunit